MGKSRRRAVIQAGVNLSGPNDVNGPPLNTELYGRPIAATYELVIDRTSPANRTLDLSKLDDGWITRDCSREPRM